MIRTLLNVVFSFTYAYFTVGLEVGAFEWSVVFLLALIYFTNANLLNIADKD